MADAVDFIVALACEEEGGKERFLSHTSTMIQWPNAMAPHARRHVTQLDVRMYDIVPPVRRQVAVIVSAISPRLSYPPV